MTFIVKSRSLSALLIELFRVSATQFMDTICHTLVILPIHSSLSALCKGLLFVSTTHLCGVFGYFLISCY